MHSPPFIGGKYQLVSHLGRGATGVVYRAENVVTGRHVALKLLDADVVTTEEDSERLLREARAAGRLESRHIAQVLDAGAEDGRAYVVFELLRGADLAMVIANRGRLDPMLALRLVGQAAMGLAKAHAAGILHRDIKPANLFVAREDNQVVVKVLDFGLAKAMTADAIGDLGRRSLTNDRTLVGSPLYMSPEQVRGSKSIDGRSDLWSLGVVLYEAITGRTPHESETTIAGIILAICAESVRLSERFPGARPDLAALVDRALERDVVTRFQTAEEMIDAIRELAGDLAVDAAVLEYAFTESAPMTSVVPSAGGGDETLAAPTVAPPPSARSLSLGEASQVIIETSVQGGYVLASVRGRMKTETDADTSTAFFGRMLQDAGLRTLVLDARYAAGTKQGHTGLWAWLRERQDFDRFAILVESSALLRGFNAQAEEDGLNARAFETLEDAEAWLRGPSS